MILRIIALLCGCILFGSCGPEPDGSFENGSLFVGVLPDLSANENRERHQPLIEYLEGALDRNFELVEVATYSDLVTAFENGEIQLAKFGGLTFLQARARAGAIPIAMRDVDLKFSSAYLVPADSPAKSLEDLRGKRFCFGSELSTSGHLMPRFFLKRAGIDPESFFSEVHYSEKHDETAIRVRDGEADIGVANAAIVRKMYRNGQLSEKQVRILDITPKYTNYVWAARPELGEDLCAELLDAFLALEVGKAGHEEILEQLTASGFVPALNEDFLELTEVARLSGLMDPES